MLNKLYYVQKISLKPEIENVFMSGDLVQVHVHQIQSVNHLSSKVNNLSFII